MPTTRVAIHAVLIHAVELRAVECTWEALARKAIVEILQSRLRP